MPEDQAQEEALRLESEMVALSLEELIQLDAKSRTHWMSNVWLGLSTQDLPPLFRFGSPDGCHIPGILSFHPNGYVRQKALQELVARAQPQSLPYVILRLNDWVGAVVQEAGKALQVLIHLAGPAEVPLLVALALRMVDGRRASPAMHMGPIAEAIVRADQGRAFLALLHSEDPRLRRKGFTLALICRMLPQGQLVELSAQDRDPAIRALVLRGTLDALPDAERRRWIQAAAEDSSAMVQSIALQHMEQDPELKRMLIKSLVWARSASIRDRAIWELQRIALAEPVSLYKAELAGGEGSRTVIALMGLGRAGSEADVDMIRPWLSSGRVGVEKAALWAMCHLGGLDKALLISKLGSAAPGVSRLACDLLMASRAAVILPGDISGIFCESELRHVRLNVWRLACRIPRWHFPEFLGAMPENLDAEQVRRGRMAICRWTERLNRGAGPSSTDLDRIRYYLPLAQKRWGCPELGAAARFLT